MNDSTITQEQKQEMLETLKLLKEDFELLDDDSWIPERHSIDASIDNVEKLQRILKGL